MGSTLTVRRQWYMLACLQCGEAMNIGAFADAPNIEEGFMPPPIPLTVIRHHLQGVNGGAPRAQATKDDDARGIYAWRMSWVRDHTHDTVARLAMLCERGTTPVGKFWCFRRARFVRRTLYEVR